MGFTICLKKIFFYQLRVSLNLRFLIFFNLEEFSPLFFKIILTLHFYYYFLFLGLLLFICYHLLLLLTSISPQFSLIFSVSLTFLLPSGRIGQPGLSNCYFVLGLFPFCPLCHLEGSLFQILRFCTYYLYFDAFVCFLFCFMLLVFFKFFLKRYVN